MTNYRNIKNTNLLQLNFILILAFLGIMVVPFNSKAQQEKLIQEEDANKINNHPTKNKILVISSSRINSDKALNNQYVAIDDTSINPSSVTELLSSQPGLSTNGQPGLFQTVNIRGLARQRVQTYLNGMQITSERRAGVALSFIDPLLLSGVEVTQGPASTYYGSGAIAGTLHLQTRQQENNWYAAGFSSDGNELSSAFGTGDEDLTASIAYRQRNNGETSIGDIKNNHFEQHSLVFLKTFQFEQFQLDWHLIESQGNNIGKDNNRYPLSRITSYPEEKHWLSQLALTSPNDWSTKVYFHHQSLITQDIRPMKQINHVTNDSLDLGFSFDDKWQSNNFSGLYGVDYFGRRNVDATEEETNLTTQTRNQYKSLINGKENEMALFATANQSFDTLSFHVGARANYQSQKSEFSETLSENYFTYFFAVNKTVDQLNINLNYGTGFRFASLSERLFTGTTGRGTSIGNPNLNPEKSRSIDLGLDYQRSDYRIEFHTFRTEIDDFIEKIKIDNDNSSYLNITNGRLIGWQYQMSYTANHHLSLILAGQNVEGEDYLGNPLTDIPQPRHQFTLKYHQGNWLTRFSYSKHQKKPLFADGELPLNGSEVSAIKIGYQFSNNWNIQLNVNNLFNENYYNSADDLSTLASGREFSLMIFNR